MYGWVKKITCPINYMLQQQPGILDRIGIFMNSSFICFDGKCTISFNIYYIDLVDF